MVSGHRDTAALESIAIDSLGQKLMVCGKLD